MSPKRLGGLVAVISAVGLMAFLRDRENSLARTTSRARGEALYCRGHRASGRPVTAVIRGDLKVDGLMFACVRCHLTSGFGAAEGRIIAPPIDAESLFHQVTLRYKGVEVSGAPPRRPAYTRESLGRALRTGVDPSGRAFDEAMPRYELDDQDLDALIDYLGSLSQGPAEGVTDGTIRLASVVTDEVPVAEREAMLFALEKYVAFKNAQVQPKETGVDNRSARMATSMLTSRDVAFKRLVLTPWLLRGAQESWPRQLEALYEESPPFALVGGLTTKSWAPIHEFSEAKRLPTLLPLTDLPALSIPNTYTLYVSRGVRQEAEGVARYLAGIGENQGRVVQIVRDTPIGQALRAGFEETSRELGRPPPTTVVVAPGEAIPELGELAQASPAAVLLWDDAMGLSALERLTAGAPMVFVSASALGDAMWTIDEPARAHTYVAWPYRLPSEEERYVSVLEPWLTGPRQLDAPGGTTRQYRVAAGAYAVTQVLTQGLMDLRGRYSRDYLLDVLGMLGDQRLPAFEQLSFGVGLRTVSNGCYVAQLGPGPSPTLIKRSTWLTH